MSNKLGLPSKIKRLKELPVAPTILTACNLACGVSAILCASKGDLYLGACLIFAGMIFDMFDGKIARMTNTEGAFGAELDSLCDVVSFGLAPAFLVHKLVIGTNVETGLFAQGERSMWLIAVFYCVMAAIRLAKYNVEHSDEEATKTFSGIPSPGAAVFICSWIIFQQKALPNLDLDLSHNTISIFFMLLTVASALLMVSNIPFPHLGNTLLGKMSFRRVVLLFAVLFVLLMYPVYALVIGSTFFVLMGVFLGIKQSMKKTEFKETEG